MVRSALSLLVLALSCLVLPTTTSSIPERASKNVGRHGKACNEKNLEVRKEWSTLSPDERKAYTAAVRCIYDQPSNLDRAKYPAAINRFLDYAVIHVERSLNIHLSGFFLTWHRYYVQLWYDDIRHTCGYKGPMPYWSWPDTADNLQNSPVFDGSETSMSGDGAFNDTGPIRLSQTLTIPHGTGGGCVFSGPFANLTISMDIIPNSVATSGAGLPATAFAYKPQCLRRDLNTYVAQKWTNAGNVSDALNGHNIHEFEAIVDGNITESRPGIHSGSHFQVGGQMANLFVSPQDPIWYLAHTYLDKLYTEWQEKHPEEALGIVGTETFQNIPPSDEVTLDTPEPDWGYFHPSVPVRDLISTTAGPFCYRYE